MYNVYIYKSELNIKCQNEGTKETNNSLKLYINIPVLKFEIQPESTSYG